MASNQLENESKELVHPLLDEPQQPILSDRQSLKSLFNSYDAITPREKVHRRDSMKDLKLRIIHGPLHSTAKPTICCCCIDTIAQLSVEERVIILTCGYTRECFPNEIPPVIIDLCSSYVGSSKEFDIKVLKSFAESRQKYRVECINGCQNCWTDCCKDFCSCEMFFDHGCCCYCWNDTTDDCVTYCCKCWRIFECFTYYGCCFGYAGDFVITILLLIFILITFGKDIAAFLIIDNYLNCNISGGSNYVIFNVYEWVLIGAISDTSLWLTNICFFGVFWIYERYCGKNCSERIPLVFICCIGCLWCFFIAWIVIGFLLYGEMLSDDDINDECFGFVISWNILQLIPTIFIICFAVIICADDSVCGQCCGKAIDCFWDCVESCFDCSVTLCDRRCGRKGVKMLQILSVFMLFVFIIGKDVSGLIINSINDCDVIIGENQYVKLFDVTEWMYIACGCHMAIWIGFSCWWGCGFLMAVESMLYIVAGVIFAVCGFLFNIAWTVIGFLFYNEMILNTDTAVECGNMVLSWNVLQSLETLLVVLLFCGVVRA
eukprot:440927_1